MRGRSAGAAIATKSTSSAGMVSAVGRPTAVLTLPMTMGPITNPT